jgi:hypothetical protein
MSGEIKIERYKMFDDLPRPMRRIKPINEEHAIPKEWIAVCLGDVPEGFRELTKEELDEFFRHKDSGCYGRKT